MPVAIDTDIEVIEQLDFVPELPCTHCHDRSSDWLAQAVDPKGLCPHWWPICEECRAWFVSHLSSGPLMWVGCNTCRPKVRSFELNWRPLT